MTDSGPASIDPSNYGLGIDLGTMWTRAAVCRSAGPQPSVPTAVQLGSHGDAIPTLVAIGPDGSIEIGEEARAASSVESRQVIRDIKRFVGDPAPLAPPNWTPERLIARLVDHVVGRVCAVQGLPPSRITLAVPTCWGDDNRRLIVEAVAARDLVVTLVSDVEAAAEQHAATRWEHDAGPIAIYDFGGGFFDAAVLQSATSESGAPESAGAGSGSAGSVGAESGSTESAGAESAGAERAGAGTGGVEWRGSESAGVEWAGAESGSAGSRSGVTLSGPPEGSDRIGGIDLDDLVVDHVCAAVPATAPMAADLWDRCASAKESLTTGSTALIEIGRPPGADSVTLDRSEFEAMIHPVVEQTVALLERAIASAGITPQALSEVLLLGGASRIPLVAQKVSAALGRPVTAGPDTDALVAHGAALLAARLPSGETGETGLSEAMTRTFSSPPTAPRRARVLQRLRARSAAPRRTTTRLRHPESSATRRSRGVRKAGRVLRPSVSRSSGLLRSSVPRSWMSRVSGPRPAVSRSLVSRSLMSRSLMSLWSAPAVARGRSAVGWSLQLRPWSILLPAMLLGASLTAVAAVALAAVAGGTTSLASTPVNRSTAPVAGIIAIVPPITVPVPTVDPSPPPVGAARPTRAPAVRATRRPSSTTGSAAGGSSPLSQPTLTSVPATVSATPTAVTRTRSTAHATTTRATPLPTLAEAVP